VAYSLQAFQLKLYWLSVLIGFIIFYSLPDINRQIKSRRMLRMGEGRKVYRVLVGKPEGKRPLERPRHRWEKGNRMNLGGCGVDSSGSG
jgi:hypothetical protein